MGFCRESWIEAGGTEEVERYGSMRNEAVQEMQGGAGFVTTETGYKVILVGLDGGFGGIGAMKVRRNELKINAGITQILF